MLPATKLPVNWSCARLKEPGLASAIALAFMLQRPSTETSFTSDQPVVAPAGVLHPAGSVAQLGGNASAACALVAATERKIRRRAANLTSVERLSGGSGQGLACLGLDRVGVGGGDIAGYVHVVFEVRRIGGLADAPIDRKDVGGRDLVVVVHVAQEEAERRRRVEAAVDARQRHR